MGREVRMVPPRWEHPRDSKGQYIPLHGGDFAAVLLDWNRGAQKWKEGFREDWRSEGKKWVRIEPEHKHNTYAEWAGSRPRKDEYMPRFRKGTATWFRMYENTSEGTPISPAFATPEELARWLADTGASAFASMTATYEQWLATIMRGSAVSAVFSSATGLVSGVAGLAKAKADDGGAGA